MPKKYTVTLDDAKVERLRDAARQEALARRRDVTWQDVLRDAADRYLAEHAAPQPATPRGGTR